jgi:RNA polymerase sigma-70 factor, ECF subfamily
MAANPSCFAQLRVSPPSSAPRPRVLPGGLQAGSTGAAEPVERAPESRTFRVDASSPDDVLAMAACGGNHRAADIIVRRYTSKVRSRLHHWIGPVDVDDHVQDAFIRLFEQLPRLRDPSALRGFLVGITLRIACTELRRRRRSRTRLTATGDLPEPRMTSNISEPAREALWRFESILGRLAPSSRRVFVLRYVEKLELTDIAEEMQISVATAKRHFARAAAAVSAMVKSEPALAEYLPTAPDAREAETSSATAGSDDTTSPRPALPASAGAGDVAAAARPASDPSCLLAAPPPRHRCLRERRPPGRRSAVLAGHAVVGGQARVVRTSNRGGAPADRSPYFEQARERRVVSADRAVHLHGQRIRGSELAEDAPRVDPRRDFLRVRILQPGAELGAERRP